MKLLIKTALLVHTEVLMATGLNAVAVKWLRKWPSHLEMKTPVMDEDSIFPRSSESKFYWD